MTGVSYMFLLGRLNNVLHSQFGFGFRLTFPYLAVIYIHISFSQCLNSAAGYLDLMFAYANIMQRFYMRTTHRKSAVTVPMFVFSCY